MALNSHQGKNAPFLSKLFVIKKSSVTFPVELQHLHSLEYSDDLTLSESFSEIDFLPNSATWQQISPKDDGVDSYTIQVTAMVNKVGRTNADWLHNLKASKLIVLALDRNPGAEHMMMGSDEAFATLTWEENIHNANIINITLEATQGHPAYYYTGLFTSN